VPPSWATSGLDIHLEVTGRGVRAGVERALREAVCSGRLRPGTVLPSSRGLAGDLGLARNTVAGAYDQLVAEGWLVARQGSRTRVADRSSAAVTAAAPTEAPRRPLPFDLRAGAPDLSSFPRTEWLGAARRALRNVAAGDLGYPDPRGVAPLREALAGHLTRARGVQASPERVVVCSGFGHGFALLRRVLHARGGSSLAVESHGLTTTIEATTATGLEVTTLPVDQDGAVIELGGQTGHRSRGGQRAGYSLLHGGGLPAGRSHAPLRAGRRRRGMARRAADGRFGRRTRPSSLTSRPVP